MKTFSSRGIGAALCALLLAPGCGGDGNERLVEAAQGQNCGATTYTAFDPANHANQDARLEAQAQIRAAIAPAEEDPALAPGAFAEAAAIYRDAAELQAKVQGRADDHFPGDPGAAAVGAEIDAVITGAIARGEAAAIALEVKIAKERIDKSLTRFFYLSVFHELTLGAREKYDEAFGYLGTGPENDPGALRGLAQIALKRDAESDLGLEPALFEAIIEGSCEIDRRLLSDGVEQIEWTADDAYAAQVRAIDGLMKQVLAASVAHELFAPLGSLPEEDAAVALHEGALYFAAIEAEMRALGGQAADDAGVIAAMFDAATAALDAGDPAWRDGLDSDFIRDAVSAAFGITVKG